MTVEDPKGMNTFGLLAGLQVSISPPPSLIPLLDLLLSARQFGGGASLVSDPARELGPEFNISELR